MELKYLHIRTYISICIVTEEVVATGDGRVTQYAVLCSEVLCKVCSYLCPSMTSCNIHVRTYIRSFFVST